MNILALANAFQFGLSIVGFIALSIWMMKWAKGLHERTKELGDLDKEIRAALNESLAAQKELSQLERGKLEGELNRLAEVLKEHSNTAKTERQIADAAIHTIGVMCLLASQADEKGSNVKHDKAHKNYMRLIELLVYTKTVTLDKFIALWKNDPVSERTFSSVEDEIVWRVVEMHSDLVRTEQRSTVVAFIAPKTFEFFLKNQDVTSDKVKEFVKNELQQEAERLRRIASELSRGAAGS